MEMCEIAVDTCFWPLYEVINGEYKLSYRPKNKRPISDWLESQGRFKHIVKNPEIVAEIQAEVDQKWEELLRLCGEEV